MNVCWDHVAGLTVRLAFTGQAQYWFRAGHEDGTDEIVGPYDLGIGIEGPWIAPIFTAGAESPRLAQPAHEALLACLPGKC